MNLARRVIFFAFGISGMAALIYEVVWTRSLSTIMGSSTYALSTMLAAFMSGLSAGGWIGSRLTQRIKRLDVAFALCELGIGLIGFLSVPIIKSLTPLYITSFYTFHLSFGSFSIIQFIIIFMIMGVPTTLMGMTFPIVIKLFASGKDDIGRQSGILYSINTLGAILGSISAGFLLIPMLGVKGASYAAASLNVGTSLYILTFSNYFKKLLPIVVLLVIAIVASTFIHTDDYTLFSYYTANRYGSAEKFNALMKGSGSDSSKKVLYSHEGIDGNVTLIEIKDERILINNGKMESGDDIGFALLAYLPYYSHIPRHSGISALSLGLGSGRTLAHLSKLPIDTIESVEINKDIIEVNKTYLSKGLFKDNRITHIEADGRIYLQLCIKKYDLIVASPSWAVEMASGELLTDEFFSLAASKLHNSGVFAVWLDAFMMEKEDIELIARTFKKSFSHETLWEIAGQHLILIGSNEPLITGNDDIVREIVDSTPELKGFFRVMLTEPEFISLPAGDINSDDKPLIEFHNARNIITGRHEYF